MKKSKYYAIMLVFGLCLMLLSFFIKSEMYKNISGLALGLGAGLFGAGSAQLIMKRYESKNPDKMKQNNIEYQDERNTSIRNLAKAKAGQILQWLVMALAYLLILINAPLWTVFVTIGVFLLYNLLVGYFMIQLQKKM